MTTKEIIAQYFKKLDEKKGWEEWIAEDMFFTGATIKTTGKDAYVQTTLGFLKVVTGVRVENLIIDGVNACAEVRYDIVSPAGNVSVCRVAEILGVRDGKIASSAIFFDTAAFREFMQKG